MCGRRCLSIVVVRRALIFFFPLPKPNANPFFCSHRGGQKGRVGGARDANMSTQQKKNGSCEDTHTFAAEYENAKVNTSCPRYDHTHGRALTHKAGMLQVQTQGERAKEKHTQAVFKDTLVES